MFFVSICVLNWSRNTGCYFLAIAVFARLIFESLNYFKGDISSGNTRSFCCLFLYLHIRFVFNEFISLLIYHLIGSSI